MTPLCINCRWIEARKPDALCLCPDTQLRHPVTGEGMRLFAITARQDGQPCGPDGALFQPRER